MSHKYKLFCLLINFLVMAVFAVAAAQRFNAPDERREKEEDHYTHGGVTPTSAMLADFSWASSVKDAPTYRKAEFRRNLKKYKACYEGINEPQNQESYKIKLIYSASSIFSEYHQPHPLQFMLFGTQGYLNPRDFELSYSEEENSYSIIGNWEGIDIGEIQAMCVGYEHNGIPSLFIENIVITKLSL